MPPLTLAAEGIVMSQTRLALSLLTVVPLIALVCLRAPIDVRAGMQTVANVPFAPGLQGGLMQRATPTPGSAQSDTKTRECMRRSADWERNRTPWSLSLGIIIFLATLYLLTFLRFRNTVFRVILSIVAAMVFGPALMAVIVRDALKVCVNPPGFIGSLTAPILIWTLAGSLGTLGVIILLRFLVVRRRFRQELPAA